MKKLEIDNHKNILSVDINNIDEFKKLEYSTMFSLIDSIIKGKYFKNNRTKIKEDKPNKTFRQNFFNKVIKDKVNNNRNYFLFKNNTNYNAKLNYYSKENNSSLNVTEKKENINEENSFYKNIRTRKINNKNQTKDEKNLNFHNNDLKKRYIFRNSLKNKSFIKYKILRLNSTTNIANGSKLNKTYREKRSINNRKIDNFKNIIKEKNKYFFYNKISLFKKEKIISMSSILEKKFLGMNKNINYNIRGFQKSATDFFHTRYICDIDYQNYYTKRQINFDDILQNIHKNNRKEYKSSKIPFYFYSKSLIKPFNISN